jgi:NAD(P)-dependent dehydrogenase (short-subunit alcohol dehydrogenase family)
MTPYYRDGTSEDVANVVVFLCSEEGGYVHGQTISLDGGWSTTKYLRPEALTAKRIPGETAF